MIYLILASVLYAIAIVLGTVAARNLNTNLSAGITNLISAVIPIIVALPLITRKTLASNRLGVTMAFLAGVCIALFAMALNKGYSENKVGIVAPIVFGGALFLSTLLSYFFLKEKVGLLQGVGLGILAIGIIVIIYARATQAG